MSDISKHRSPLSWGLINGGFLALLLIGSWYDYPAFVTFVKAITWISLSVMFLTVWLPDKDGEFKKIWMETARTRPVPLEVDVVFDCVVLLVWLYYGHPWTAVLWTIHIFVYCDLHKKYLQEKGNDQTNST